MKNLKLYMQRGVIVHGLAINPHVDFHPIGSFYLMLELLIREAKSRGVEIEEGAGYEDLIRATREYNKKQKDPSSMLVFRAMQKHLEATVELALVDVIDDGNDE
jgi:hypothetical protein